MCIRDRHHHVVADQPHGDALELERVAGAHHDGLEIGVFGQQFHTMAGDRVLYTPEAAAAGARVDFGGCRST